MERDEETSFYSADDGSDVETSGKSTHASRSKKQPKLPPKTSKDSSSDWNTDDWSVDNFEEPFSPIKDVKSKTSSEILRIKNKPVQTTDEIFNQNTSASHQTQNSSSWFGGWNSILNVASDSVNKITSTMGKIFAYCSKMINVRLG